MKLPPWRVSSRELDVNERTFLMGVLNVTPDSFSDGGNFYDPDRAVKHGCDLAQQGADILDIGGESTRPGSQPVSEEEEIARVGPVVRELKKILPDTLLSIDTSKASVAAMALEAGADIINDVTAGRGDPAMMATVASSAAGFALMHMQGTPRSMQADPSYSHVVRDVKEVLQERMNAAIRAGIQKDRLVLDPGIGFGKTLEHNLHLIAGLPQFHDLGVPLLLGVSRKRWIGDLTGRPVDQRCAGSLAGAAACLERGAHILRVHDVSETRDLIQILDRIKRTEKGMGCNST